MASLSSIPPELLLQIISHLPSSTHFLPLSQTSRSLRSFFTTHASTICNTHITTYHSATSTILLSTNHSSGWLIPSHPCVLAEERRMLRDKILLSDCSCFQCRTFLLASRTASGSGSSLTLSELSLSLSGGCFNCIPRTPSTSIECTAQPYISNITKLTTPGPQYLVFLEKYGTDIQIRHEMRGMAYVHPAMREVRTISQEGKEKSRFDFMVGNYTVRRFLEDIEKEMHSLDEYLTSEDHEMARGKHESTRRRVWESIKEKLSLKLSCLGRKKKYHALPAENDVDIDFVAPPRTGRPLMFGEVESEKPVLEPVRETWVNGLLWYHPTEESETEFSAPVAATAPAITFKKDVKASRRASDVKAKIQEKGVKARRKLGRVWGRVRCGGVGIMEAKEETRREGSGKFQSLDD